MSPAKRYAKKHAKARQRRRLQSAGAPRSVTAARRSTPPRPSSRPSMTWGFLKTSWPRSKGACGANRSCWARSSG